jgi:hypothetical protein
MNEFIESKLGEVLGFARIELDTLNKGMKAYSEYYTEEQIKDLVDQADTL